MPKTILVYVQHLLGTGHLHRTALITRALADSGFDVTVVSGGAAESIDFGKAAVIQLPAIKTDSAFTDLFDEYDNPITDDFKHARTSMLLQVFNDATPDLVLIETYPFGRRQMRFELLPLLQAITRKKSARPIVACSIRDIIQPKSGQKRIQEILDLLDRYFDYIFVHGDKSFIEFDRTFPAAGSFKDKLVYTGYVTKPLTGAINTAGNIKSILVSAGGGAVGQKLYQTVISASKLSPGQRYDWHILVGNNLSEVDFREIQAQQSDNLKIERNRNDFIDLLCQCSVSVSQGGYNTMMDILVTHTPAVIIPFEGRSEQAPEQEQLIRARAFEKNNMAKLLREKNLTASALLTAIADCENSGSPPLPPIKPQIDINGASWMAAFVKNHILWRC
ncbi:glycosyltransferase family protein [Candidatus Spongiihabitans sp.]|uniref:glycosyltransferase family protein n=1 Tax=Candidatus Spongiihabitans sp. TaxID=3101308 RepID=UPI003C705F60